MVLLPAIAALKVIAKDSVENNFPDLQTRCEREFIRPGRLKPLPQ